MLAAVAVTEATAAAALVAALAKARQHKMIPQLAGIGRVEATPPFLLQLEFSSGNISLMNTWVTVQVQLYRAHHHVPRLPPASPEQDTELGHRDLSPLYQLRLFQRPNIAPSAGR